MTRWTGLFMVLAATGCGGLAGGSWVAWQSGVPRPPEAPQLARADRAPDVQPATASVLLEVFERAGSRLLASDVQRALPTSAQLVDEVGAVLRSRAVLSRVARDADILKSAWAASHRATEPGGEDRLISALRRSIQAVKGVGAGMVRVTFAASTPADAARIANTAADALLLEDRARQQDAHQPLRAFLHERISDLDSTVRKLDTQRENLQQSRQIDAPDGCASIARMKAEAAVKDLAAATAASRAPGGDTQTNRDLITAITNDLERARSTLIDEGIAVQQIREMLLERDRLLRERGTLQVQMNSLNAAAQAGTVLRIIERPSLVPAEDAKGM